MRLNRPETILSPVISPVFGKIIFHETSPWCQKYWGPLLWSKFQLVGHKSTKFSISNKLQMGHPHFSLNLTVNRNDHKGCI